MANDEHSKPNLLSLIVVIIALASLALTVLADYASNDRVDAVETQACRNEQSIATLRQEVRDDLAEIRAGQREILQELRKER
jgi:hypothetical protein